MQFTQYINSPGEHSLFIPGQAGLIEAALVVPENIETNYFAFLGHPHSLQGGTMNNKVVTTLARVFRELNIPSLRFNFRGVGQSEGSYDAGVGESEDMMALANSLLQEKPDTGFIFAGFSFGSYVAYRAAAQMGASSLLTIAPPVHHYDYKEFHPNPSPWLIVQGMADEVVPADLVLDFAKGSNPQIPVIEFADTGHFFHGKLLALKELLLEHLRPWIVPL